MHPCRSVWACVGDSVIYGVNFTPRAFAIVRRGGGVDGQQVERGEGVNQCLNRKIVTADTRREKVTVHPKRPMSKEGEEQRGVYFKTKRIYKVKIRLYDKNTQ